MTAAEKRLKDAIEAHDNEQYYNGRIPSWATELRNAASAYIQSVRIPAPTLRDVFPGEEWEIEEEIGGGQPNGIGTIEPNDYREWYSEERETHHRTEIYIYGPWEDGPTPAVAEKRLREAERQAKLTEERAAAKEASRFSEEDEILRKAQEILSRRQRAETEEERHDRG